MTSRTRVKICGLTSLDDAILAVQLGADAVGFVFWSGSPRAISPIDAGRISRTLPPFVTRVGVFVDAAPTDVTAVVVEAALDAVQLHGRRTSTAFAAVGARIVRATSLRSTEEVTEAIAWPSEVMPIVDAYDPERHGGTGKSADWARAAHLAKHRDIILAGGLTAENVGDAIRRVRPHAVDVSSGVESVPGHKDSTKLAAFFAAVAACQEDR